MVLEKPSYLRALEIAREEGFVTARTTISPTTPLYKLSTIYSRTADHLSLEEENALRSLIDGWLYGIEERVKIGRYSRR